MLRLNFTEISHYVVDLDENARSRMGVIVPEVVRQRAVERGKVAGQVIRARLTHGRRIQRTVEEGTARNRRRLTCGICGETCRVIREYQLHCLGEGGRVGDGGRGVAQVWTHAHARVQITAREGDRAFELIVARQLTCAQGGRHQNGYHGPAE